MSKTKKKRYVCAKNIPEEMGKKKKSKKQVSHPVQQTQKVKREASAVFSGDKFHYVILAAAFLFALYCRLRLLNVPLERDEGEYAYVGQQLLQGVPPFVSIYHVKLPGIYGAYALIEFLFGETHRGIHFGLLFVNLSTAVVVYFIGRRIFNSPLNGALSALCFLIFSLSQKFLGFSANAEHFVVLPATLGILFLLKAFSPVMPGAYFPSGKTIAGLFFLSGLFLGIAYTMKQHGLFFIAFAGIYFLYKTCIPLNRFSGSGLKKNLSFIILNGTFFAVGVVLPLAILCLIFLNLGLFEKFWWWTWYYPRLYVAEIDWDAGVNYFKFSFNPMWDVFWLLFLLAGVGLISILKNEGWDKKIFIPGLLIFSTLAFSAGFYFYPHYFIHATPALGLLCAGGAEFISGPFSKNASSFLRNYSGACVLLFFVFIAITNEKDYYFRMDGTSVSRTSYGGNPFPESLVVAKYIEQNTSPSDTIAVVGSEPQIYFYAKRKSATGFIYTYEMMKEHKHVREFQTTMFNEIRNAKPKMILMVYISPSWFATPAKQRDFFILDETQKYVYANYEQVGITTISGNQKEGTYCWENAATPVMDCIPPIKPGGSAFDALWMALYKRKESNTVVNESIKLVK